MCAVWISRWRLAGVAFGLLALAAAACSARQNNARPTLAEFPGTPTDVCLQEEVLPKITDVRPPEAKAGSVISVSGTGGFLQDDCGGINESTRVYRIFLDDEPVTNMSCAVNHCEGKFTLPESIQPGPHCLGVQKGSCQTKMDVVSG